MKHLPQRERQLAGLHLVGGAEQRGVVAGDGRWGLLLCPCGNRRQREDASDQRRRSRSAAAVAGGKGLFMSGEAGINRAPTGGRGRRIYPSCAGIKAEAWMPASERRMAAWSRPPVFCASVNSTAAPGRMTTWNLTLSSSTATERTPQETLGCRQHPAQRDHARQDRDGRGNGLRTAGEIRRAPRTSSAGRRG